MKYRVQYFEFSSKQMKVCVVEAEDSSGAKSEWSSKNGKKGKLSSVCEVNAYNAMLQKYGDLMKP